MGDDNSVGDGSRGWNPEKATNASDGLPDKAIVPYVRRLNDAGVETYQSCSGHVHDDGRKSDGCLWFESDELDPEALAEVEEFHTVCRRYARSECWDVKFRGLARSEVALQNAMNALFANLGVDLP